MIIGFRHKGLELLYREDSGRKLPPDLLARIRAILVVLDTAAALEQLSLPTYRLHQLKGDRKGFWAVTVRANWRIVFRFENGDAHDVDFVDYH